MPKPAAPRESAVEARLVRGVRTAGGRTFKLAPTTAGIPDRLVVLPGGQVHFVELKADRGRTSPIQRVRLAELSDLGAATFVLYGYEDVDEYLAQHAARR